MRNALPARFGIVVRRHRQAHGWSQEALADRAGLSRSFSGDVERGRAIPSLDTLIKIADALGLSERTVRRSWEKARLLLFGHALLEQLVHPRKGLTAHVWRAQCAMNSGANPDGWLAAQLTPGALAAKPFTPLPVLGIPGWWPENLNFSFYDDSLVFRPPRRQNPTTTAEQPPGP